MILSFFSKLITASNNYFLINIECLLFQNLHNQSGICLNHYKRNLILSQSFMILLRSLIISAFIIFIVCIYISMLINLFFHKFDKEFCVAIISNQPPFSIALLQTVAKKLEKDGLIDFDEFDKFCDLIIKLEDMLKVKPPPPPEFKNIPEEYICPIS